MIAFIVLPRGGVMSYHTLMREIVERRKKVEEEQAKLFELIRSCPHDIQDNGAGWAQCVVCGTSFGWFCPTAPNKHCEYKDDPDSCIYCGQPEERK